jgi:hypothetical protein
MMPRYACQILKSRNISLDEREPTALPCHPMRKHAYVDLADYCRTNPRIKGCYIAEDMGVTPSRFSKLKLVKHGVRPTEEEVRRIADLIRQTRAYVRELYRDKRKSAKGAK